MVRQRSAHLDAQAAARSSSVEDNLAYLQANIGYFLSLDTGRRRHRLSEILATMSVVIDQLESIPSRFGGVDGLS